MLVVEASRGETAEVDNTRGGSSRIGASQVRPCLRVTDQIALGRTFDIWTIRVSYVEFL